MTKKNTKKQKLFIYKTGVDFIKSMQQYRFKRAKKVNRKKRANLSETETIQRTGDTVTQAELFVMARPVWLQYFIDVAALAFLLTAVIYFLHN